MPPEPCETCHGSGYYHTGDFVGEDGESLRPVMQPCPDCARDPVLASFARGRPVNRPDTPRDALADEETKRARFVRAGEEDEECDAF